MKNKKLVTKSLSTKIISLKANSSLHLAITKLLKEDLLFIIDKKVFELYQKEFQFIIDRDYPIFICNTGESSKTFKQVETALEFFLERGVTRNSHLVAIGGGATSDFGGLIAALLLRGIKWSIVTTTLLGMVDASIGGKTGINSSSAGKNLIGAFHFPTYVWHRIDFLKTLSKQDLDSGKGEILKYALLSKKINALIKKRASLQKIILACAQYKLDLVRIDPLEQGKRIFLNYGHTIGHALEKAYSLPHGIAVILGILEIQKLYQFKKISSETLLLIALLKIDLSHYNLGFDQLSSTEKYKELLPYLKNDKKRNSKSSLRLVLIPNIGKVIVKNEMIDQVLKIAGLTSSIKK